VQTTPPAPAQRGAKSTYDNLKGTAAWPPADVISAELLRQREPATRAVLRSDSETDSRFGRHSLKSCAKSFVRLHCQRATSCVFNYCEPNRITVVDQRRRSDLRLTSGFPGQSLSQTWCRRAQLVELSHLVSNLEVGIEPNTPNSNPVFALCRTEQTQV